MWRRGGANRRADPRAVPGRSQSDPAHRWCCAPPGGMHRVVAHHVLDRIPGIARRDERARVVAIRKDAPLAPHQAISAFASRIPRPCIALASAVRPSVSATRWMWFPWMEKRVIRVPNRLAAGTKPREQRAKRSVGTQVEDLGQHPPDDMDRRLLLGYAAAPLVADTRQASRPLAPGILALTATAEPLLQLQAELLLFPLSPRSHRPPPGIRRNIDSADNLIENDADEAPDRVVSSNETLTFVYRRGLIESGCGRLQMAAATPGEPDAPGRTRVQRRPPTPDVCQTSGRAMPGQSPYSGPPRRTPDARPHRTHALRQMHAQRRTQRASPNATRLTGRAPHRTQRASPNDAPLRTRRATPEARATPRTHAS